MNRKLISVVLLLSLAGCKDIGTAPEAARPFCPSQPKAYYYYYFRQPLSLIFRTDQIALQFVASIDSAGVSAFVDSTSDLLKPDSLELLYWELEDPVHSIPWKVWGVRLIQGLSISEVEALLAHLNRFDELLFATPAFFTNDQYRYKAYVTNEFGVQVRDSSYLSWLQQTNSRFNLSARRSRYLDTRYYMEVPKQLCRNSLEMANYFTEEFWDMLEFASPNWLMEIRWFDGRPATFVALADGPPNLGGQPKGEGFR